MIFLQRTRSIWPGFQCGALAMLIVAIGIGFTSSVSAQVYHVRPGASGNGSGADWDNAHPSLPATLERGATYYLADGFYGSYNFNDPASGSQVITIKKATQDDHGNNTAWDPVYGDGIAQFVSWTFSSPNWVLDGAGGGGPQSWELGHGFKVVAPSPTSCMLFKAGAENIEIRHTEATKSDLNSPRSIVYAWADFNSSQANDNLTFSHCWFHTVYGPVFHTGYNSGWIVEYCKLGNNNPPGSGGNSHSEIFSLLGNDAMSIRHCYLYSWRSTGAIIAINGPDGGTGAQNVCEDVHIHGNIFDQGQGAAAKVIAAIANSSNDQYARRWRIHHNTFINLNSTGNGVQCPTLSTTGESNNSCYNNIFYGNTDFVQIWGVDSDYNSYQGNGQYGFLGPNDQPITADPFVNFAGKNFALAADAGLPAGRNLAAFYGTGAEDPLNVDMFDTPRGGGEEWSRGAIDSNTTGGGGGQTGGPGGSSGSFGVNGIVVTNVTSTEADIRWSTGSPASSVVDYGPDASFGTTASSGNVDTDHSVSLTGLAPNTVYQFEITATPSGEGPVEAGPFTFMTLSPDANPPVVRVQVGSEVQAGRRIITVTATEELGESGVVSVELTLNGAELGTGRRSDDTSFVYVWDTYDLPNGSYVVEATARDAEGNVGVSRPVTATVANPVPDLDTGLVGHWSFDQVPGGTALDGSGSQNDGTVANGGALAPGILQSSGLGLNGSDVHVEVPNSATLDISDNRFSLCVWVKLDSTGTWQTILGKVRDVGTHDSPWYAYDLAIRNEGDLFRPRVGATNSLGERVTSYSDSLYSYGSWHHFVGVYDGIDLVFFVDGEEVQRLPMTGDIISYDQPLFFGRNGAGSGRVKGVLDDVRVYDRALSPVDVLALYRETVPKAPGGLRPLTPTN